MEKTFSMIKERIIELLEYKGIAKENFYKKIGVTSANFRGKAKESDVVSATIEKILSEMPDVNLHWLITGKGEMLTNNNQSITNNGDSNKNIGSNINGNNGNITISHNDMIDLKKELTERLKVCQEQLSESQAQTTTLLEILKKNNDK